MQMLSPETAMNLMQHTQIKDPSSAAIKGKQSMEDVARDFEAVFIGEMIKPMFEGLETDPIFGGGKGEEIFKGMMLQEYGKNIADKDMTGIQTQVMHKLIQMQAEQTAQKESTATPQSNAVIDAEFTETLGTEKGSTPQ
tara:strand:+ start:37085 stop:37501 length:417 start_codon:yes stop_codon:yes gene_type:complete